MTLPFLTQLVSLALLAYVSGLLMGLSLFRGEIGRRPRAAAVAPPLSLGSNDEAPAAEPQAATTTASSPIVLPERLQTLVQIVGPAGLLMGGMLLVLILGSMLISWLG